MTGRESIQRLSVPREAEDCTQAAARLRRDLVAEQTGAPLDHIGRYPFEPAVLPGNIETSPCDWRCRPRRLRT